MVVRDPWASRLARFVPELVVFAALSVFAFRRGQDLNYDQLNYHFLYAHLFLTGQVDRADPSLIGQHYYNPLVNVPWTLGVQVLPPRVLTLAVVAVQTVNVALVRRIAEAVFGRGGWLPLGAALLGVTGPTFLSVVGTSFTDASTSVLVLGAVLLLLRRHTGWALAGVGLLAGAATGLKLTNAVYVLGVLSGALYLRYRRSGTQARTAAPWWLLGGAVAGTALTGLWWSVYLWQRTGNPVFPYYNRLFRSNLLPAADLHDSQFLPSGLGPLVMLPYRLARGHAHLLEQPVRDARWLLLLLLAVAAVVAVVVSLRGRGRDRPGRTGLEDTTVALLVFSVVSVLAWVVVFRYLRYLIPIELLTGVFFALAAVRILRTDRLAAAAVVVLGAALLAWGQIPDWGHGRGFGDQWYGLRTSILRALPAGSVVVTDQDSGPVSYAAVWLPDGVHLVGISQGIALVGRATAPPPGVDLMQGTGLDRAVRRVLLDAHRRGAPQYVLRGSIDPSPDLEVFGVVLDGPCQSLGGRGNADLQLCPSHLDPRRAAVSQP